MAETATKMVADLRTATGLGMMECKKALVEAEGNFNKTEEILRIKFGVKVGKLAGCIAARGASAYAINGNVGILAEVNCETDFVAKNAGSVKFVNFVAKTAAEKKPASVEELNELVEAERKTIVAKLGENMLVCRFQVIGTTNQLVAYIHGALVIEGMLAEYRDSESIARRVGMHIVVVKPQYASEAEVDAETIEEERHIYTERAIASGRPVEIATETVKGRIHKFLAGITLNGQAFVMSPDQTVARSAKENGTEVISFVRYKVGDGVEKAVVGYAVEVTAAVKI